ncbi:MAG: hypothetical protein L6R42_004451, partial [Xanthoria sp. 1 TBL-2021]
ETCLPLGWLRKVFASAFAYDSSTQGIKTSPARLGAHDLSIAGHQGDAVGTGTSSSTRSDVTGSGTEHRKRIRQASLDEEEGNSPMTSPHHNAALKRPRVIASGHIEDDDAQTTSNKALDPLAATTTSKQPSPLAHNLHHDDADDLERRLERSKLARGVQNLNHQARQLKQKTESDLEMRLKAVRKASTG